jgi:hypothetical protein
MSFSLRSRHRARRALLCLTAICLATQSACARTADSTSDSATSARTTPEHVDSIVPREVALTRFRKDVPDSLSELESEFTTRDAVVAAFVKRLAARDTAGLRAMALSKAEFAWIYYPTNPIGLPPYDLSPGLMWFQFEGNSRKGLVHALEERGGRDLKVVGYRCESTTTEGDNRVHNRCALKKLQAPGDTVPEVLFGGIIERHGRFKLIGFTNKL